MKQFIDTHVLLLRIRSFSMHTVSTGAAFAIALMLIGGTAESALAAAPSSTFRFALPGGGAIVYGKATNPQAPLARRAWQQAIFYFPNGTTFSVLPKDGDSTAPGALMQPPHDSNISPSGQYVVIERIESGSVSSGPAETESGASREYCSAIEIRTGCITADQTGEICGAGWRAGQPAQWGNDDQTNLMLKEDRPSASRLMRFIRAGQPPRLLVSNDSGAGNLLRCDPPSAANRGAYQGITAALHAAGARNDARLIDDGLSKADIDIVGTPLSSAAKIGNPAATISVQRATLYKAPDDASAGRAYLVKNDRVSVLKQSPSGWAYVDYGNASGKHLLRWIKSDQLTIEP